jgi:two-component system, LytTR family, sensor kinase
MGFSGITEKRARVSRLKLLIWVILFWTALSLFFASQIYLLVPKVTWSRAFALSAPRWYVWGLLVPGICSLDRKLNSRSLSERVALHVPLGVAWTLLAITIRLVSRPLRGSPWPPSVSTFFVERFYWDLLIYAVIAGVSVARDYAWQVKVRDHEAHALALRTTDLERRLIEAQLDSLRAQLHPHFLFNALNTISAFTETAPQMARRLMERLGHLLRASLRHATTPEITLGEELTFLDDYIAIESARFEGRITVSVHISDELVSLMVPSFLLQPLVENAIRHGVSKRLSPGHVEVAAYRDGSLLSLRVRDDGVGLPQGWQFPRDAGIGLRNIASRLEHVYGRSDIFRIVAAIPQGVEAQIDLPLRQKE